MTKNIEDIRNTIVQGDCLEVLRELPDNSVDSVVTDPPYGLSKEPDISEVLTKWLAGEDYEHRGAGFMGKSWDSFVPGPAVWREVYRVLKPGGHALVFAGTRTQDLMTVSLRMAGFEVRDVIEWLYFSGFPKSMDVGKAFDKRAGVKGERKPAEGVGFMNAEGRGGYNVTKHRIEMPERQTELARKWDGWGTALKPAHEPIIVVRKPLAGTVADNVERYGTGAINIDGCRIDVREKPQVQGAYNGNSNVPIVGARSAGKVYEGGRFPANCVTLDSDEFYSKYFNVSPPELSKKASKKDRNSDWKGEEIALEPKERFDLEGGEGYGIDRFNTMPTRNNHPTVKPTDLMAWLVRLVTPPDGIILDPFTGSGSTLAAARREGFDFVGIEREPEYVEIARARAGVDGTATEESEELAIV